VNFFNNSALIDLIAADDIRLWVSCSVEPPGFCTQSTVIHPGSVPATTSHPTPVTSPPTPGTSHPTPGTSRPTPGTSHPAPDANNRPTSGAISTEYSLSKLQLLTGLLLGVVMVFAI